MKYDNKHTGEHCEVDAMGALIPSGKEESLDKVQQNIRHRFNLGGDK
ncbi:hypothetical protein M0R04_13480 [Candidatus Dojkabacteria bacterium]|jgi:hypothetical protein|nr:hypothetical protein [Candidatus Dojkabacteria bacterium]